MTQNSSTTADLRFHPQFATLLSTQLSNLNLTNIQRNLFERIPQLHNEIYGATDYNMLYYSARKMVQVLANFNIPDKDYDVHSSIYGPVVLVDRYIEVLAKEKSLIKNSKTGKKILDQDANDLLEVKLDSFVVLTTLLLRGPSDLVIIEENYGHLLTSYIANLIMDIIQVHLQQKNNSICDNRDTKELTAFVSRLQVTHKFSRKFNHFIHLYNSRKNNFSGSDHVSKLLYRQISKLPNLIVQIIVSTLNIAQCLKYRKENHLYLCTLEELGLVWTNDVVDKLAKAYDSGLSRSQIPYIYDLSNLVVDRTITNTFKSENNLNLSLMLAKTLAQKSNWNDPIITYDALVNCFLSYVHYQAPSLTNEEKSARQIYTYLPDLSNHGNSYLLPSTFRATSEDIIHLSKVQLMESPHPITFISDSMVAIMSWLIGSPPTSNIQLEYDTHDIFSSFKHVYDSTCRRENTKIGTIESSRLGRNSNYLLFYSCWESMRYCFNSKFKTPYGSVKDLLLFLQSSLDEHSNMIDTLIDINKDSPSFNDPLIYNIKQGMLLNVFDMYEKLLKHHVENPTSDFCQIEDSLRYYYVTNERLFVDLLSINRQKLSKIAMKSRFFGDAWYHASMSLFEYDMKQPNSSKQSISKSNGCQLEKSLQYLYEAAKGFKDIDLLYGLDAFVTKHDIKGMAHLKLSISNLECRYEDTLRLADEFISGIFNGDYVVFEIIQQDKILKLAAEASINLGQYELAERYNDRINNIDDRLIFSKLIKLLSLSNSPIHRETFARTNYDVVKRWLSCWNDDEHAKPLGELITPMKMYPFNLSHYLLASIARIPNDFQTYSCKSLMKDIDAELNRMFTIQSLFHPSFIDNEMKILYLIKDLIHDCNHNNPTELPIIINRRTDDSSLVMLYNYLCYFKDVLRLSDIPQHKIYLDTLTFSINCLRLEIIDLHKRLGNEQILKVIIDKGLTEIDISCQSKGECGMSQVTRNELELLRARYTYEKIQITEGSQYSGFIDLQETLQSIETGNVSKDVLLRTRNLLVNVLISKSADQLKYIAISTGNTDTVASHQDSDDQRQDLCSYELLSFLENNSSSDSMLQSTKVKALETLSKWAHLKRKRYTATSKVFELAFETDLNLLIALESRNNEGNMKKLTSNHCALRILSMIREHGLTERCKESFQAKTFVDGTINTWVQLSSQLLSITLKKVTDDRQDHSEQGWQSCLFNLLKRICSHSPQTLIYPVLVGNLDIVEDLQHVVDPILGDNRDQKQTTLKRWLELKLILQRTLTASTDADIVTETEKFIKELRKITSLWGEHLFNISGRIMQRIQHLLKFLQELKSPSDACQNTTDEKQKHVAVEKWQNLVDYSLGLMKTIMSFIERQSQQIINSKYETWFCSAFSKTLLDIMSKLDQISKSLSVNPSEDFDPFSESNLALLINVGGLFDFCRHLVHEYNKDNRNKLYMEVISPALSRLESSCILMPGCNDTAISSTETFVFISKVKQVIKILISKTCPKKLTMLGSDGKNRSFILKGHEDLRLDKHIMQFFTLVNQVLLKNKSTRYKYSLRHYAVTPLSTRSGLIQWIDALPIYSFYRAWLSSNSNRQRLENPHKPPHLVQPIKPHEIFYNKLTLLGNQGVAKILSVNYLNVDRKKWNTQLLVKVLWELEKETPDTLIADHLWIKSVNAHEQWTKTQNFIHSCSVMSMVGYLIGLGDRHMDNILLDSDSGEVIHIDYNMSFDLARTWLRIPEQVPFRLTQNFIRAFGFAGLEGGFTRSCEKVLNVLKENKSTLLHLLNPLYWEFIIESDDDKIKSDQKLVYFNSEEPLNKLEATDAQNEVKTDCIDETSKEFTEIETFSSDITDCDKNQTNLDSPIKLASQNLDYHDGFDLSQTLNMQRCIKTPTRLTKAQALDEYSAIESKLDGTDELVRSYQYQQKTERMKPCPAVDGPDLIGLVDTHTTEEQVEALIHAATSNVNKARMYEGWTSWV